MQTIRNFLLLVLGLTAHDFAQDDCCLQLFGLKKLIVQTAGSGGVGDANLNGIQAMFLQDPDVWKAAINHAVCGCTLAGSGLQHSEAAYDPELCETTTLNMIMM